MSPSRQDGRGATPAPDAGPPRLGNIKGFAAMLAAATAGSWGNEGMHHVPSPGGFGGGGGRGGSGSRTPGKRRDPKRSNTDRQRQIAQRRTKRQRGKGKARRVRSRARRR